MEGVAKMSDELKASKEKSSRQEPDRIEKPRPRPKSFGSLWSASSALGRLLMSKPRSEVSPSSARSRPNFELPEGLGGLPQPAQAP